MAEGRPSTTTTTTNHQPNPARPINGHGPSVSALRCRRSIHSSSRRTPCPVCGRQKDGDCRWAPAEWISCHSGPAAAATSNLRIGDVLTIDGLRWALVATTGGHSGSAYIYRPHQPSRQRSDGETVFSDQELTSVATARTFHAALRPRVRAALDLRCWESQTAQQLAAAEQFLASTLQSAEQSRQFINQARRIKPAIGNLLPVTDHWIRALGYQLADLTSFYKNNLHQAGGRH